MCCLCVGLHVRLRLSVQTCQGPLSCVGACLAAADVCVVSSPARVVLGRKARAGADGHEVADGAEGGEASVDRGGQRKLLLMA